MEFKPGVPIGNRIDIVQSRIRQNERAIRILWEKRVQIEIEFIELGEELKALKAQFNDLTAERAEE